MIVLEDERDHSVLECPHRVGFRLGDSWLESLCFCIEPGFALLPRGIHALIDGL
jgi:hypothetical protein